MIRANPQSIAMVIFVAELNAPASLLYEKTSELPILRATQKRYTAEEKADVIEEIIKSEKKKQADGDYSIEVVESNIVTQTEYQTLEAYARQLCQIPPAQAGGLSLNPHSGV